MFSFCSLEVKQLARDFGHHDTVYAPLRLIQRELHRDCWRSLEQASGGSTKICEKTLEATITGAKQALTDSITSVMAGLVPAIHVFRAIFAVRRRWPARCRA
jgi:hypothetical protein